jgi:hypothetical protein
MWFTYAVMQIFFGGFSGLDKPSEVDSGMLGARNQEKLSVQSMGGEM